MCQVWWRRGRRILSSKLVWATQRDPVSKTTLRDGLQKLIRFWFQCLYMLNSILSFKAITRQGMVVQACNLSTHEMRKEDLEFKASLGYVGRPK